MPDDPSALPTVAPSSVDEADYDAIYATIEASERGRAFLEEYGRRVRHADTIQLLAAITRIEDMIRERGGEPYQSARPGPPAAAGEDAVLAAGGEPQSAAKEEIAAPSAELLDLDDVAPLDEFGVTPMPDKTAPEPAGVPAAPEAPVAPASSLPSVAIYDVAPVDFVAAKDKPPPETAIAEPPPAQPAITAKPSIDVMREIELELFSSEEAAAPEARPDAVAEATPEAARTALLRQASFEAARQELAPSAEPPASTLLKAPTAKSTAPATPDGESPRPERSDPLAALKALSPEERIALFT